jgi:hypothetical protein
MAILREAAGAMRDVVLALLLSSVVIVRISPLPLIPISL